MAEKNSDPEMTSGKRESLLAAYSFAQESRNHNDLVAWEITAIVWGAQTLLLGFVLDALANKDSRPLILLTALLGIVLTFSNNILLRKRSQVCEMMRSISVQIEDLLEDMEIKPQRALDRKYRRGTQRRAFFTISYSFYVVWIAAFEWTLYLMTSCE